jgi:CelD/BcsL family acetyltransferase involved in cellulose biosynthesis
MQEVTAYEDYPQAFQEMVRLHNLRWQAVSLPGNFSNGRILDFHRVLLSLKTVNWQPRFFLLANEGKSIAALYAFLHRDKLFYYQAGYDPDYDKYSPGMALIALILEYAIGQHLREFDFLRGDESYKWKWTNEYRRTTTYSIFQQRVKCGIQFFLDNGLQEMKRQLKR